MIVKIQVKSKPAVINALNKSKYLFFVTHKLHNVNIILVDAFPGVTDAFPMPPLVNLAIKNMVPVKAFAKLLNF